MQPIKYKDVNGYFITEEQYKNVDKNIKAMSAEIEALKKAVEIARGESKYKLKKLANIIERKDKQIAELKARLGEV